MDKSNKIAVFETSQIFERGGSLRRFGGSLKFDQNGKEFFSTGRLEQALEDGYTVYVISSRSEPREHDEWWLALVDRDRVIFTEFDEEGMEEPSFEKTWEKLYELLDLPWNDSMAWMEARESLKDFGILTGCAFAGLPKAS